LLTSQNYHIAANCCCFGCQLVLTVVTLLHTILLAGCARSSPPQIEGGISLLLPPGAENPSYVTALAHTSSNPKPAYTCGKVWARELNWTELTCNKSTQLHDAFIGRARQRHDVIGCSETRSVIANWSLVQFMCCEHALSCLQGWLVWPTDRQTYRHTEKGQRDRQAGRQRGRQTDRVPQSVAIGRIYRVGQKAGPYRLITIILSYLYWCKKNSLEDSWVNLLLNGY